MLSLQNNIHLALRALYTIFYKINSLTTCTVRHLDLFQNHLHYIHFFDIVKPIN